MKKIAIIGAGGFGREIIELLIDINKKEKTFTLIGFFEDNKKKGELINGYPILGQIDEINEISYKLDIVVAVADPFMKKNIISNINNPNINYPILVHPNALIGVNNVSIDKGTIICAGCIITCDIQIGKFVILNLCCTVGHDTIINDFSSFMPTVNISGDVIIENGVYVGTGAKIINQLTIGKNTIIGAGAVVSKSLPANCTAVGIPAKPIKFH